MHGVVVGAGQFPAESQTAAAVLVPLTHDATGPHGVPGSLLVLGLHIIEPDVHEVVPSLQGMLSTAQVWFGTH
jgi:hypothetical protein